MTTFLERTATTVETIGRAIGTPGRLRRWMRGERITEEWVRLAHLPYVAALGIRTFLDVGANEGQCARSALVAFPNATVHSFEPLEEPRRALDALARSSNGRVVVHAHALGDHDGEVTFNTGSFTPASSVLAPANAEVDRVLGDNRRNITVPLHTLDTWMRQQRGLERGLLLKLDVQGFEPSVLRGADALLEQTDLVVAECIVETHYEGQGTLGSLCQALEPHGFRLVELMGVTRESNTRRPRWLDAVFLHLP